MRLSRLDMITVTSRPLRTWSLDLGGGLGFRGREKNGPSWKSRILAAVKCRDPENLRTCDSLTLGI